MQTRSTLPPSGRVAVLAGSLRGALPAYQEAATRLGTHLAEQGIVVLLPETTGGLAQAVATGARARGGQLIEVVWQGAAAPWPHPDHIQRYEAATLYQRQALLLEQADAVVALPSGPTTVWDVLGGMALAHLAQQSKPLALLNVADWFSPLLRLLSHLHQTGFVSTDLTERYLLVDPDPWCLVQRLLRHPRWPASSWQRLPEEQLDPGSSRL